MFARWPSGPLGPVGEAGATAAAVTKAILAKGRRPVAANTLLYDVDCLLLYLNRDLIAPHDKDSIPT